MWANPQQQIQHNEYAAKLCSQEDDILYILECVLGVASQWDSDDGGVYICVKSTTRAEAHLLYILELLELPWSTLGEHAALVPNIGRHTHCQHAN